jgi:hypothetical protein
MRDQRRRVDRLERNLNISSSKPMLTLKDVVLAAHEGKEIDFDAYANGEQMRKLMKEAWGQTSTTGEGERRETKGN